MEKTSIPITCQRLCVEGITTMLEYENRLTTPEGVLVLFSRLESILYKKRDNIDVMLFYLDVETAINKAGHGIREILDLLNVERIDDTAKRKLRFIASRVAEIFEYWKYLDESELMR